MSVKNLEKMQIKLELITRKWWFFLIFILIQFIPPYASKGFEVAETGKFIGEVLSHSLVYNLSSLNLIFKILPLVLVIGIILFRNRVTRIFNIYVVSAYFLFAFLQNIAFTERYGLAIITTNMVMFILVAIFWIWEAAIKKMILVHHQNYQRNIWLFLLPLLPFGIP